MKATMTTLEIMDIINSERKEENKKPIKHYQLLRKARSRSAEHMEAFETDKAFEVSEYKGGRGKMNPFYIMDKMQALTLVGGRGMDYRVAARVMFHLEGLESKIKHKELREAEGLDRHADTVFKYVDAQKEVASLISEGYHPDIIEAARRVSSDRFGQFNISRNESGYLTPKELGEHFGLTGSEMNNLLIDLGLQAREKTKTGLSYTIEGAGRWFGGVRGSLHAVNVRLMWIGHTIPLIKTMMRERGMTIGK
jgi:hypothetical protein